MFNTYRCPIAHVRMSAYFFTGADGVKFERPGETNLSFCLVMNIKRRSHWHLKDARVEWLLGRKLFVTILSPSPPTIVHTALNATYNLQPPTKHLRLCPSFPFFVQFYSCFVLIQYVVLSRLLPDQNCPMVVPPFHQLQRRWCTLYNIVHCTIHTYVYTQPFFGCFL